MANIRSRKKTIVLSLEDFNELKDTVARVERQVEYNTKDIETINSYSSWDDYGNKVSN